MVSAPASGAELTQPVASGGLTMNFFRHSPEPGEMAFPS
jgi:hypothetical protein